MYSYLFNIYYKGFPDIIVSILLKAKDRFSRYESIFVKVGNGKQEEWKAGKEGLYDIKDIKAAYFFEWLEMQSGLVPYEYIYRHWLAPYELYTAVKSSVQYDITVETKDPVEDFGDPGSYFDDQYDPNVVY
ncbi:MAG: hypothetical protein Q3990_05305 [Desulfovibrionaceae bacterium]|nr:hypothetical protein [Desulfovibrionaceae bacterium]